MPTACGTTLTGAPTAGNTKPTYSFSGNYYIYCNNPEPLIDSDLGDNNLGNKYILWSDVTGTCQAWYEHTNSTGHAIGYGLQVYNPNSTSVQITVANIGFGSGTDGYKTSWAQFFTGASGGGGTVGTFTVPAYGVLWIQKNSSIANGLLFEGTVRFTVSGGRVSIANYAWYNYNNIDGTATYLGRVTGLRNGQDQSLVYKGIATMSGGTTPRGYFLTNTFSTSVSALLSSPRAWRTNGCQTAAWPDATLNDMVEIKCPLTGPSSPTYLVFACNSANLGNWGLQYWYSMTVSNDTANARTVNLVVAQPLSYYSNVYVSVPDGNAGCRIQQSNWKFYSFILAAGANRTVEYQVILCGDSTGGIVKSVVAQ